jgi:uncharacterized protein (DUF1499 family)
MHFYSPRGLIIGVPLILACCAGGPGAVGTDPGGRLQPCPSTPNCVSTQAVDPDRRMAPLPYRIDRATSWRLLLSIVDAMPRTTLVVKEDHYLRWEFRSRVFGFVDDVEFVFDDEAAVIDFRSASRTGYSDMGVNRKRMAAIGEAYRSAPLDDMAAADHREGTEP